MKYSVKLSDAVHILTFVHFSDLEIITSKDIAHSIKTNPSYVRQLMSAMKKNGIINNSQGKAAPILSKKPAQISLLDIYQAVEGDKPLLHLDTHINPECGIGVNIQYVLRDTYNAIQNSINQELASISLQSIFNDYQERISFLNTDNQ